MQENTKDSGSFITGFGMGLITGAAAYFLFTTEQGKELRKRALDEWDSTQKTITEEVGIEFPKRLRQLLQEVVGYFAESIREIEDLQHDSRDLPSRTTQSKNKKPDSAKKPSGRFKGM